jgi:hypothetical protein
VISIVSGFKRLAEYPDQVDQVADGKEIKCQLSRGRYRSYRLGTEEQDAKDKIHTMPE